MEGRPSRAPGFEGEAEEDAEVLVARERWLVCVDCGGRITRPETAISVNGAHEHEFMNPEALRFVVRCFAAAPGCQGVGERSTVWSWFPGSAWEIELCASCLGHVGWSFHGATTFYGLIRSRLVER